MRRPYRPYSDPYPEPRMRHAYSAPSWKKWIPVYGFFREEPCDVEGKPLLLDFNDRRPSYKLNWYYHLACFTIIAGSAFIGLGYCASKIKQDLKDNQEQVEIMHQGWDVRNGSGLDNIIEEER